MSAHKTLSFLFFIICCAGCAKNTDGTWKTPLVYRVDVQQGNVIDQSMINKLKPGMDKNQVKFILGTPLLVDPFHSDRWDYLFSMEKGSGERQQRHITLYFDNELLQKISGDIITTDNPVTEDEFTKDRTVIVPLDNKEEGFFSKLWGSDDEEKEQADEEEIITTIENDDDESIPDKTVSEIEEKSAEDEYQSEEPDNAEKPVAESVAEIKKPEKEKGVLRRFWERVTSSEEDSTSTQPETERDRRDLEVFEKSGGEL